MVVVEAKHTTGSPHDGRWNMGSLFHAGGTSVTVRFGPIMYSYSFDDMGSKCPTHRRWIVMVTRQRLIAVDRISGRLATTGEFVKRREGNKVETRQSN